MVVIKLKVINQSVAENVYNSTGFLHSVNWNCVYYIYLLEVLLLLCNWNILYMIQILFSNSSDA